MTELQYPFDSAFLLKNRRKIRKQLLADGRDRIKKRIAVLGGSTTTDICSMLEIFLLDQGIQPLFYQSEYGQYWQDAMFPNDTLEQFKPDFIYIHTTTRNLTEYHLDMKQSAADCTAAADREFSRFSMMWERLRTTYGCAVIQNNFELPRYRMLGNSDVSDVHGMTNYVLELNSRLNRYAQEHKGFYVHDILSLSACCGLDQWHSEAHWCLYKYAMAVEMIPAFAHNLAKIFKSLLGKNKKAFALDLDNTLWGGVIGDDGVSGIEIGQEGAQGQAYAAFQSYLKAHQSLGVLLTVCSKNEAENARLGLEHPENVLRPDDFRAIRANWEPKSGNIAEIAAELTLLPESFVFVDDNPAERAIVRGQLPGVAVPELEQVEEYIRVLDRNSYFEVTDFSEDDAARDEMYRANAARTQQAAQFENYTDYLLSLEMHAEISPFSELYLPRITQLTNKSNQFNLTTRRYTESEMREVLQSDRHIHLCGRLADRFGDNGIVALTIGEMQGDRLEIQLWLMSCRVLKRDMELAMLDTLVAYCRRAGIRTIHGVYLPTAKNGMVRELYATFGFKKLSESEDGESHWELSVDGYSKQNHVIDVKLGEEATV
ncbi:MAG: HAD-IIIC family phosphatase [Ruminococcus sp.]|nr:HAD-IIIC family phosphatase [Ruminococcus sp.]